MPGSRFAGFRRARTRLARLLNSLAGGTVGGRARAPGSDPGANGTTAVPDSSSGPLGSSSSPSSRSTVVPVSDTITLRDDVAPGLLTVDGRSVAAADRMDG